MTSKRTAEQGFMGSVRRISLVKMHNRRQSDGFGMAAPSPGNSAGGLFNRRGSGSSSEKGGPMPVLFDHCQMAQRAAQEAWTKSAGTTSTLGEAPHKTAHA